jgi:hypothetical protein
LWIGDEIVVLANPASGHTDKLELIVNTMNRNHLFEEMVNALEQIAEPIAALQKYAKKEGRKLDGHMAVQLSTDPHYLRGIASAVLAKIHKHEDSK